MEGIARSIALTFEMDASPGKRRYRNAEEKYRSISAPEAQKNPQFVPEFAIPITRQSQGANL